MSTITEKALDILDQQRKGVLPKPAPMTEAGLKLAGKVLRECNAPVAQLSSIYDADPTIAQRSYERDRRVSGQVASVWMAVADQMKEW